MIAVNLAVVLLLALLATGGALFTLLDEERRPQWGAGALAGLLSVTAVLAWIGGDARVGLGQAAALVATLAAVTGGGPLATAVLRAADPLRASAPDARTDDDATAGVADPDVLRGGAWIGALERAAVAGTLLAGWPEGLAVILAVKGLGRYNELRTTPAAAERFIIGTLASALWAAACVGVAVLLRG
jgi:hypothetical protein